MARQNGTSLHTECVQRGRNSYREAGLDFLHFFKTQPVNVHQPVAMATPLSESTANARQVRPSHPPPPAPSPSARAQHRGAPHSDAIAQVAVPLLVALHAVPLLVAALLVARAHVRRSSRGGGHLHSQSPVHPLRKLGKRGRVRLQGRALRHVPPRWGQRQSPEGLQPWRWRCNTACLRR